MGGHGCVIPGRGCEALQALERLYQQSPTAAIIMGVAILVVVCMLALWLRDVRGQTNWEPHRPYEPPEPASRNQEPAREGSERQESSRR